RSPLPRQHTRRRAQPAAAVRHLPLRRRAQALALARALGSFPSAPGTLAHGEPRAPARRPAAATPYNTSMILVTNDDGIDSQGLVALQQALRQVDEVVVLAPDRNW